MKRLVFLSLAALMIPAVLFALVGCIKPPAASKEFGPEVTLDQVKMTLGSVVTTSSSQIQKGEFSYVETSIRLEGGTPEIVKQVSETVVDKRDNKTDNNYFDIDITRVTVEYQGTQAKRSESQDTFPIRKAPPQVPTKPEADESLSTASVKTAEAEENKVTFHNLKRVDTTMELPKLVGTDCGGLPKENNKCKPIRVTKISYDIVEWKGENRDKSSVQYLLSPDVPFFSAVMSACIQMLYPINGFRVNLLQCEDVQNLNVGSDKN